MIRSLASSITQNEFLVVGGEGQLGSSLVHCLQKAGQSVHATYITNTQSNAGQSFLDLGASIENWETPGEFKKVFLCAAVTSGDICRTKPFESHKINVENTLNMARRLSETGAALFFPSTNLVFDGTRPFQKATDPVNPQCEYGRQKVYTEKGLTALTDRVAIIRFTKIISPGMALLKSWIKDLRQGRKIFPFSDMVLAPVSLRFAIEAILSVMEKESYGLWQVSATEDVTYEQMARSLAWKIGASPDLIQPISAAQSGLALETLPEHTALDTGRLTEELGLKPPSVSETLDEIFLGLLSEPS